jgi:hypothetical protein
MPFRTIRDSRTPENLTPKNLTPDSGVGVGVDIFSKLGLGLPQVLTMGGLVISRAEWRAISARKRTTAHITIVSTGLCTGFVVNKTVSCELSELEKLIGMDPLIERSLIMIKGLNILRKQLYEFNHQDIKLRWEMFLNRVDEIYIIEYAIADRSEW